MFTVPSVLEAEFSIEIDHRSNVCDTPMEHPYRLSDCLPFSARNRAFIFTCFIQLTQAPLFRITYLSQPDQLIGKKSRL